jgi:uncharacterized membrane protein YsdA (DUF1294 family)
VLNVIVDKQPREACKQATRRLSDCPKDEYEKLNTSLEGLILTCLLVINVAGLVVMYVDKRMARLAVSRIPERWILSICLLGGTLGVILGMFVFHHKNKKRNFQLGVLTVVAFHVTILVSLVLNH